MASGIASTRLMGTADALQINGHLHSIKPRVTLMVSMALSTATLVVLGITFAAVRPKMAAGRITDSKVHGGISDINDSLASAACMALQGLLFALALGFSGEMLLSHF